jgi:lysophospholipase L1-like esterase
MGFLWRRLVWTISVIIATLVLFEFLCFGIITASIYFIYGQLREGEPVTYDAYALYLLKDGIRPTVNNPPLESKSIPLIWMFGGSTTRGISDDDSQTMPSFLAKVLNQEDPKLSARVVNFGNDGYNCLMETKYLEKMLIESPTPPRLIVFYDGANDATYFAQYRTPEAHHGYRQVRGLVESYHASFFGLFKSFNAAWYTSYARELYDKMRQGIFPLAADDPALLEFRQAAVKRYAFVEKVAKSFGADFLLFWQPCWWVETAPVDPAVKAKEKETIIIGDRWALKHNFVTIYQGLWESLRHKPYFVDFRNILTPRRQEVYESDGIHLNPAGDGMVASQLGQFLKKRFAGNLTGTAGQSN